MFPFRMRNVLCEYSMDPPNAFNRDRFPGVTTIPTFHIFGVTEQGQKTCVHVHGVLPYLLLRVGGDFSPRLVCAMQERINLMIHRELMEGKEAKERRVPSYVHKIEPVSRKSIYGYQEHPEQFTKVYLLNPFHITKLCHALSKEVDSHPGMQPFEAHVPFTLQFFIDYCIFGMDEITFKIVYLRSGPKTELTNIFYEGVNLQKAADSGFRQSPLPPITLCVIEYDAWAEHIMNAEISGKNEYSSNPGLEYIWKEETARCRIQGTIPEDKCNHYIPRPYYKNIMEKDLLSKVKDIARSMREHGPSNINLSNLTHRLDDTVIPDQKSVILEGLNNEVLETWTCQIDEKKSVLEIEEEYTANIEDAQKSDLEDDIGIEDDEQHMNHLIATVHYKGNKDEIGETMEPHEWAPKKRSLPQWFSLDKDLPLMVRNKIGDKVDDNQLCVSTDVTMSFDDASFRQMPGTIHHEHTNLHNVCPDAEFVDGEVSEIKFFTVASLEILVQTQSTMPDPITDPILGFSLCVVPDVCRFSTPSIHVFMSTLPVEVFFNGDVMWAENEYSLLENLVNLIRRNDPDMLLGYDTDRLSWGYVFKRAEVIGYSSLFEDLSRFNNVSYGWQRLASTGVEAPHGRLLHAIWRIIRSDLQLRSYDRGTATLNILKKKIPVIDDRSLSKYVETLEKKTCSAVSSYLQRLSLLNISLLWEINWFLKTAEMSRVYGIQFHEVWTRGSQLRVESMLLRLAHAQGYVAPSITSLQRNGMDAPEQLQLIMEPESKVYFDPVIVLDFQSLYPSMIIAYNYCYSTLFGKIDKLSQMVHKNQTLIKLGALNYRVPQSTIIECVADRVLHCSPLSGVFSKKSRRDGLIPIMLREILGARIMVKTAAKHTKNRRLQKILDARQLALKLVANVTYGYTAANWSGRMPCVEVADAILGKGRETLERAIKRVNTGEYEGARVIYGDTDSLFVLLPDASLEKAFAVGRRIAADITNDNPAPVVLKLEKVYTGCVLETKKRYAGWMFENETESEGRLDSKGIETIRRDTCPIVAKVLERSLELIFSRSWRSLSLYLDAKLSRLHTIPYVDYIFYKEYRGGYANDSSVPQRKIATSLSEKCPAHITLQGERLPYVIVEGPPDATVISCVRSLPQYLANPSLKINISYYMHAHILASLRRVTDLLPLRIHWNSDSLIHCFTPGCIAVGSRPWCISCINRKSSLTIAISTFAREQRLRAVAYAACANCQRVRQVEMENCQNNSCVVKQVWNGIRRNDTRTAIVKHAQNYGNDGWGF